ncbi:MAG: acyl-CoA dehydrogenase [Candidatus Helarchaeota archaeon]|nr:acyl-CoA dehydrogenase [Candidatus Helarchaeota archaeon]
MNTSVFYTKEELEFQKEIRTYLQENIPQYVEPALRGDYSAMRKAIKIMAKKGLLGAIHQKKYGGTEKGVMAECIISEECGKVDPSINMTRAVSTIFFGMPLSVFGTEEQKEKYLPKIISGEQIGAICMSEDEAGSDLSNMQTKIVREGDEYIINGHKKYITNGSTADILAIFGVLEHLQEEKDPRKRITGFLVESKTKGFKIAEEYELLGIIGATCARLEFDDLRIPVENLLGKEGKGFPILMSELNVERAIMAASCVGNAQAAFDIALKYSNERVQFGRPVSRQQAVSFRIADSALKIHASRLLTLEAARYLDQRDEEFATLAASMAFANASEMQIEVTNACIQTLAGKAITYRYELPAAMWRAGPVMWVVGGTTDIQKFIVQRQLYKSLKLKKD